jgi:hypothetical protein
MRLFIQILLFFLSILFVHAQKTSEWKFVKNENGIKVYNKKEGKLDDVKIETVFDCKISTLTEAMVDVSAFPQWIYKLKSAKVTKQVSQNQAEVYTIIDMPWPTKDRDLIVTNKISQNPKTKEVTLEDVAIPKAIPEQEDIVRIKDFYTKWVLKPSSDGIHASYFFHSDPGGDMPDFLTNLFINEGPVQSIKSLKKLIKNKKYQNNTTHKIID